MRPHHAHHVAVPAVCRGGIHVLPCGPQFGAEIREGRDAGNDLYVKALKQPVERGRSAVEAHVTAHHHARHPLVRRQELIGNGTRGDQRHLACRQIVEPRKQPTRADDELALAQRPQSAAGEGVGVPHAETDDIDLRDHSAPPKGPLPARARPPRAPQAAR